MDMPRCRLKRHIAFFISLSLVALMGCATTGGPPPVSEEIQTGKPEAKIEEKPAHRVVERISVVGKGDAVLIEANGPAKYTAFLLSDPSRLIVDLPGVDVRGVQSPMTVDNNFITEIITGTYGEEDKQIGRVEIGLREGVDSEIKSGEDSILVELKRDIYIAGVSPPSTPEAVKEAPEEVVSEAPAEAAEETPAEAAEEPPAEVIKETPVEAPTKEALNAKNITAVDALQEGDTTVVRISGDGEFGNYNSFGLDSPTRVVVDVWGVGAALDKKDIAIDSPFIKKLRIGAHPDKARLVFDSQLSMPPFYSIAKEGNWILVRFTKGKEKEKPPLPKVSEVQKTEPPKPVEKKQEKEYARVTGVDFKKLTDKARLTISTSGKPKYDVNESGDGKTLTIDIFSAAIDEALSATLDAADLKTQVDTISSYQASSRPEKNVQVLVKLNEKTPYEVTETNGTIKVDFPITIAKAEPLGGGGEIPAPFEKKEKEEAPQPVYTGKRIDIDMIDAQVTDVVKLLAEVSNLNIITSEDVKGTITLRLKNVPWDQAFDLILKTKGLDSVQEGNVVRVAPIDKIRKEREERLASKKAEEKLEDLETEYIRVNYDKASELSAQLKGILSDRGSITVHETTNTLIVKDIRSAIEDVKDYVKRVDIPIPQVLIEARIVEAESSFARDLGIQWGVDHRTPGPKVKTGIFGSTSQLGSASPQPDQQAATYTGGNVLGQSKKGGFLADTGVTNYAVNLPASGTAGTLGALGFILGKTGANPMILDLRISAGEQEGLVKTISRPRIITMNNKEAKIEQGESIPFQTTGTGGASATAFVDANLSLTVTPQITPDGSVLMEIKANRNSIGSFRASGGQPSINKKEATTNVLVRDGETTVIGGIIVSDTNKSEQGIPLFKDIPILGWLFKSKSISDTQRELLIFITPTIMKEKTTG